MLRARRAAAQHHQVVAGQSMAKKLSKAERLIDEQMLALLEWAADHPKRWHDIGKLPESQKAAELLAKRGVIEIRQPQNQYKLTPKD
jgi:hypothetical protein